MCTVHIPTVAYRYSVPLLFLCCYCSVIITCFVYYSFLFVVPCLFCLIMKGVYSLLPPLSIQCSFPFLF